MPARNGTAVRTSLTGLTREPRAKPTRLQGCNSPWQLALAESHRIASLGLGLTLVYASTVVVWNSLSLANSMALRVFVSRKAALRSRTVVSQCRSSPRQHTRQPPGGALCPVLVAAAPGSTRIHFPQTKPGEPLRPAIIARTSVVCPHSHSLSLRGSAAA